MLAGGTGADRQWAVRHRIPQILPSAGMPGSRPGMTVLGKSGHDGAGEVRA
jgi:hypothetical protein